MAATDTETGQIARPRPKKKTARKRRYELHTWVGFHLAVLMTIILATGTIATVSNEIDWLIQHDMRVSPDGDKVSWGEMTEAVQAAIPDGRISVIKSMDGDHFAYRADVTDGFGQRIFVHVNQWTGEVTGTTHPLTVQRFFRDLHRYLFMPNFIGLPLVCSMAFILAISLYTGLRTSRNWGTLMTRIRFNRGARIAVGDAHKAAGLWGSWFFIVMIVTSVWYLAEFGAAVGGKSFEPDRPSITAERLAEFGDVVPQRSANEIVAAAEIAYPELNITEIQYPFSPNGTLAVLGRVGNPILRDRANRVFLDPLSLEPLVVQRSNEIGWIAWLNETADPLHFGFFGGLPTKLIWFVFGVFMTGLSVTGVWLTWKRLKSKRMSSAQFATLPILLVSMVFGYFWYERLHGPTAPVAERALSERDDGAIRAVPHLALGSEAEFTGEVRLLVSAEGGAPNLRQARFTLETGQGPIGEPFVARARRPAEVIALSTRFPDGALAEASRLSATLEFFSGREIELTWELDK
ncbi:MAG: PepSY-associated TM helix domain-containing protein [Henriciella sp.]